MHLKNKHNGLFHGVIQGALNDGPTSIMAVCMASLKSS
jgi:hypothetical protein